MLGDLHCGLGKPPICRDRYSVGDFIFDGSHSAGVRLLVLGTCSMTLPMATLDVWGWEPSGGAGPHSVQFGTV